MELVIVKIFPSLLEIFELFSVSFPKLLFMKNGLVLVPSFKSRSRRKHKKIVSIAVENTDKNWLESWKVRTALIKDYDIIYLVTMKTQTAIIDAAMIGKYGVDAVEFYIKLFCYFPFTFQITNGFSSWHSNFTSDLQLRDYWIFGLNPMVISKFDCTLLPWIHLWKRLDKRML